MPPINAALSVTQIATLCPDLYDGMYSPLVATLTGGRIYKFTQGTRPEDQQVASPWWFTEAEFQKMKRFLDLDPSNIGFIARSQAAVKYEWSSMDTLVSAKVLHPIRVFVGPGRWQVEKTPGGSQIVFQAPDDVQQCYIPGVSDRTTRTLNAAGRRALGSFQFSPITSGDAIDDLMRSIPGKTIIIPGNPALH
jgi:hypothetical protein